MRHSPTTPFKALTDQNGVRNPVDVERPLTGYLYYLTARRQ
jgi:hypothetical protein